MDREKVVKEMAGVLNGNSVDTLLDMPDWVIANMLARFLESISEMRELESKEWAKPPATGKE